jgi:hypothetical protein
MRILIAFASLALLSFPFAAVSQQQVPASALADTAPVASAAPAAADNGHDSTITVFREGDFTGAAHKPSIDVDGKEVDRLSKGSWFSVHTEPGKHQIQSSAKNEPATVIETKARETSYVRWSLSPGPGAERADSWKSIPPKRRRSSGS